MFTRSSRSPPSQYCFVHSVPPNYSLKSNPLANSYSPFSYNAFALNSFFLVFKMAFSTCPSCGGKNRKCNTEKEFYLYRQTHEHKGNIYKDFGNIRKYIL